MQDLTTGEWSDPELYFQEGGWERFKQDWATIKWSKPEEYGKQALAGGIAGAVAGVVGLAGGSVLGLAPGLSGALSGFAAGTSQQLALNLMEGGSWRAGVGQSALVGAAGGAAAGDLTGKLLPANAGPLTKAAVGGLTGGVVSGGTHVALNVASGRPWNEGLGQAVAVGAATGLVDAFTDYALLAQRWRPDRGRLHRGAAHAGGRRGG